MKNECSNPKCRGKFGLTWYNPPARPEKYCSKKCFQEGEEERLKQRQIRWFKWLHLVR